MACVARENVMGHWRGSSGWGDFPKSRIINIGIVTPDIQESLAERITNPSHWEKTGK